MFMQPSSGMEAQGRGKVRGRGRGRDLGFCFPKSMRSLRGRGDASRNAGNFPKEACVFELLATVAGQLLQEQTSGLLGGLPVDLSANRTTICTSQKDSASDNINNAGQLLGGPSSRSVIVASEPVTSDMHGEKPSDQLKLRCTQLNFSATLNLDDCSRSFLKCDRSSKRGPMYMALHEVGQGNLNLTMRDEEDCEHDAISELNHSDVVMGLDRIANKLDSSSMAVKHGNVDSEYDGSDQRFTRFGMHCEDINMHGQVTRGKLDENPPLVSSSSSEGTPSSMGPKVSEMTTTKHPSKTRVDDGNSSESTVLKTMSTKVPRSSTSTIRIKARKLANNTSKTRARSSISKRKRPDMEGQCNEGPSGQDRVTNRMHMQNISAEHVDCPTATLLIDSQIENNCCPSIELRSVEGSTASPCVLASSPKLSTRKSGQSHVQLNIKSFIIPQLLVELPESATVANLKKAVMEAAMNLLGGGLCVRVLLEGQKVLDESASLLQVGITNKEDRDSLSFMLEPSSIPTSTSTEESLLLLSHVGNSTGLWCPVLTKGSGINARTGNAGTTEGAIEMLQNCSDTKLDMAKPSCSVPVNFSSALVPLGAKTVDTTVASKRRMRRPFSTGEVEALVQAVEKLGTGRWRDVKLYAFSQHKHRTYVDLKDKWKTLVHTASIAPHQRRGEPVPQGLLDRVIHAHSYWTAKTTGQAAICGDLVV